MIQCILIFILLIICSTQVKGCKDYVGCKTAKNAFEKYIRSKPEGIFTI